MSEFVGREFVLVNKEQGFPMLVSISASGLYQHLLVVLRTYEVFGEPLRYSSLELSTPETMRYEYSSDPADCKTQSPGSSATPQNPKAECVCSWRLGKDSGVSAKG